MLVDDIDLWNSCFKDKSRWSYVWVIVRVRFILSFGCGHIVMFIIQCISSLAKLSASNTVAVWRERERERERETERQRERQRQREGETEREKERERLIKP